MTFDRELLFFIAFTIGVTLAGTLLGHGDVTTSPENDPRNGVSVKHSFDSHSDVESRAKQPVRQNSTDASHHSDDQVERESLVESILPGFSKVQNVHPMMVHFPIVLFWTAGLFAMLSWFWHPERFLEFARWLFWLGLISIPFAAGTGFLAVGGWGGGHVVGHRNLMLLTSALAVVLFGVLRFISSQRQYRIVLTVGLVIVLVFLTLGADRGAWLVFEEGAGVNLPEQVHEH